MFTLLRTEIKAWERIFFVNNGKRATDISILPMKSTNTIPIPSKHNATFQNVPYFTQNPRLYPIKNTIFQNPPYWHRNRRFYVFKVDEYEFIRKNGDRYLILGLFTLRDSVERHLGRPTLSIWGASTP